MADVAGEDEREMDRFPLPVDRLARSQPGDDGAIDEPLDGRRSGTRQAMFKEIAQARAGCWDGPRSIAILETATMAARTRRPHPRTSLAAGDAWVCAS